jgi:predicted dehydrogenase
MIKIGIIGMSPGNAHPYSWSAIINGRYDADEINSAGFPAVSAYLKANQDTLGINSALVTHVWTQDRKISESIAKSGGIEHISSSLGEMAGCVDAVLLTRDDPENHVEMARPFIDSGLPVFIDKPVAVTLKELKWFSEKNTEGRLIMSCSSMRYANEGRTLKTELSSLGKIELITATGKKDWVKYGVHMIEAVAFVLDDPRPISVCSPGTKGKETVIIEYENGIRVVMNIFMNISSTFQISVYGEEGWKFAEIRNSYSMFRDNIIEFLRSVQEGKSRLPFDKTEKIIRTLIAGKESQDNGGRTIRI